MLWVLNRTVSMEQYFRAPRTNVKMDGKDNNQNFTQKKKCLF